jgi:hypothetical protein
MSLSHPPILAFTAELAGTNLPVKHAPWKLSGTLFLDGLIADAVRSDGVFVTSASIAVDIGEGTA